MASVLYRKNGGEVLKISQRDQLFDEIDEKYFGILFDPTFPDGMELREELGGARLGPLRVLGLAKRVIPEMNLCRNATVAEIAGFPAREQDDENQGDADRALEIIINHPVFRKVFAALDKEYRAGPPRSSFDRKAAFKNLISRDD